MWTLSPPRAVWEKSLLSLSALSKTRAALVTSDGVLCLSRAMVTRRRTTISRNRSPNGQRSSSRDPERSAASRNVSSMRESSLERPLAGCGPASLAWLAGVGSVIALLSSTPFIDRSLNRCRRRGRSPQQGLQSEHHYTTPDKMRVPRARTVGHRAGRTEAPSDIGLARNSNSK